MSNMPDDFDDKNKIDSQSFIFLPDSDIVKYESPSFQFNIITSPSLIINNILFFNNFTTIFFKELLQELYLILSNTEVEENYDIEEKLKNFIDNFLFEYDLDPKNVFNIMTFSSQNIFCYSSLIGFFYQHGIGCKVDKIKAFGIFSNAVKNKEIYQLSSDKNNEAAFCNDIKKLNEIILQYFYSLFLYKDITLNRKDNYKFHIKNAKKGDPVSQYYVGNCYYYGRNVQKNHGKAVKWYSKSSKEGNIKATYRLAICYFYGEGIIVKDEKKAFELCLKSAEEGHKLASYMVGYCYKYGTGVLKNECKAFEWYLKAAKRGDSYSRSLVANYYNDGKYFPIKNEVKGFYWNRKTAINGYVDAQYKLANYHLNNKNERKAFNWYLKIANKDSPRAIYLVAKCYRDGIGTDKNLVEATKWFKEHESKSYSKPLITLNDFLNGSNMYV